MSAYSNELIPAGKETHLIRFTSTVEGLVTHRKPNNNNIKHIKIGLLVMCVLSGVVGLSYLFFDPVVRSIILSKLTLSRTSDTFYIWEDPPISPHLKVYFWNFTNPEAFFLGLERPKLVEVGPYTYRQKWLKQNVTWHEEEGTISFRTRKIFSFSPSDSCVGCNDMTDKITTLNVPAISAYYQMRESYWTGFLLTGMINTLGYDMWTTKVAHELLWGHQETLFEVAKYTMPSPPPFQKFGFFLTKNTSREEELGMYTMYTGQGDPYKLANIAAFNNKTFLDRWNDTECDRVHGSDGASFNPYIQKHDTLWFFNDQLCRTMPLVFDQQLIKEGLPGYRFKPREDVFMSPERFPEQNACFAGDGKVLGDGVFDVTTCQFEAPIVLSWPHFLHAEEKFQEGVQGLKPDEEKHSFYFDIQPITGTTLSAKARIQINVMVRNNSMYPALEKVKSTVVPVLWFEEGIDELGEDIVKVLRTAAVDPKFYRQYILYCFIVLLSVVILLGGYWLFKKCMNIKVKKEVKKVREQIQDIVGPHDVEREQAEQPMLSQSTDSSRVTTACHSRNCSEGIKPPYISEVRTERSEQSLLEKLPPFVTSLGRSPPYNAIKVDDLLPEDDLEAVDDEEEEEEEEEGDEEEGEAAPNVVLIKSRHRISSSSFST